jgi:hypothetical protein
MEQDQTEKVQKLEEKGVSVKVLKAKGPKVEGEVLGEGFQTEEKETTKTTKTK